MELDGDPQNETVHQVLTDQLLHLLEDAHHAHVVQEGLDINKEPEASYIPEKRALLERLRTKKREQFKRLVASVQPQPAPASQQTNPPVVTIPSPPPAHTQPALPAHGLPDQTRLDSSLPDDLQSGCSNFTSASRMSQGPAILQKLKNNKSRQQSRITAVEAVVNHPTVVVEAAAPGVVEPVAPVVVEPVASVVVEPVAPVGGGDVPP